jgi:hypothetical protein
MSITLNEAIDAIDAIDDETAITASTAGVPAVNTSGVPTPPSNHRLVNPFVLFRQQNASGGFFKGDIIKLDHSTGAVLRKRGNNETVIPPDQRRYVVNPNGMVERWAKFVNGELVQPPLIYRTAEGEMAPMREELDDLDWKRRGLKRDPWQREVYLPMKAADGEIVAFKATGNSAIAEIGELVGMYGSADRGGKVPVVEIDSRSFDSQHGNTIHVPVFRLIDWELWDGQPMPAAQPVAVPILPSPSPPTATAKLAAPTRTRADGGDMDDEIPF